MNRWTISMYWHQRVKLTFARPFSITNFNKNLIFRLFYSSKVVRSKSSLQARKARNSGIIILQRLSKCYFPLRNAANLFNRPNLIDEQVLDPNNTSKWHWETSTGMDHIDKRLLENRANELYLYTFSFKNR